MKEYQDNKIRKKNKAFFILIFFRYQFRYFFRYQIFPIPVPILFSGTKFFRYRYRYFFPVPNFSDTDTGTFFRYQIFPIPVPIPPKKMKIPGTGTSHSAWNIETLEHSKEPASMWDKWKRWRYNCPGWGEYVQQEGKQGEGSTFRFDTSPPCAGLEIAKKSQIWKNHQFICFKDCHCSKKIPYYQRQSTSWRDGFSLSTHHCHHHHHHHCHHYNHHHHLHENYCAAEGGVERRC